MRFNKKDPRKFALRSLKTVQIIIIYYPENEEGYFCETVCCVCVICDALTDGGLTPTKVVSIITHRQKKNDHEIGLTEVLAKIFQ